MHLETKLVKEIRNYHESIYLGLSLRQFIFSVLSAGAALGLYLGFNDALGQEITTWICIAGAAPFALFGFYKYQGMPLEQFLLAIFRYVITPKRLIYRPTNLYFDMLQQLQPENEQTKEVKQDGHTGSAKKQRTGKGKVLYSTKRPANHAR